MRQFIIKMQAQLMEETKPPEWFNRIAKTYTPLNMEEIIINLNVPVFERHILLLKYKGWTHKQIANFFNISIRQLTILINRMKNINYRMAHNMNMPELLTISEQHQ